jgi:DUF1016 N-terminal domain/YhcG PDDEXK nuclease domain
MRQFYLAYTDFEIVSAMPTQLSWTHNLEILSQTKTMEERAFYLNLTLKEKLNYRELRRHLKTSYFERSILANQLLPPSLDNYPRDVSNIFKDSYIFEFARIPEKHLEKDFKKAHENPSIGVLICKNKDLEVVEYALRRNLSPTLVADYSTKLMDKALLIQKVKELFRDV